MDEQRSSRPGEPSARSLRRAAAFGIYGRFGEDGETLSNDLDECHGHTHEIEGDGKQIEWDGKQVEMYHYHATYEYPYTIGCFRGTPSEDEDLGALDPSATAPPGGGA